MQAQDNKTRKGSKREWKWTKKRIVLASLGGVLLILIIWGGISLYQILNPGTLFPNDHTGPGNTDGLTPQPSIDPDSALAQQADLEFMKNRVNIMMLGVDEDVEREDWGSFRTDTMILVTIDFNTQKADMISIPRDSYVKIYNENNKAVKSNSTPDGILYQKINAAFSRGGGAKKNGYAYTLNTVQRLVGVPVNYYFSFDMEVVKEIVDAMGGVYYDVDVEVDVAGIKLKKGYQHLNGAQVLSYCRQRKGSSDIARIDRQQRMLMTIFRQLKNTNQIANLPSIYQAVERNIQTNLSFKQICSLALLALRMDESSIERHMVEGQSFYMNQRSYWGINTQKLVEMINNVFGITIERDYDIDAGSIIKKLEADSKAYSAAVLRAKAIIKKANAYINDTPYLSASSRQLLNAALLNLDAAMDAEDAEQINDEVAALESMLRDVQANTHTPSPAPSVTPSAPPSPTPSPGQSPSPTMPPVSPAPSAVPNP